MAVWASQGEVSCQSLELHVLGEPKLPGHHPHRLGCLAFSRLAAGVGEERGESERFLGTLVTMPELGKKTTGTSPNSDEAMK